MWKLLNIRKQYKHISCLLTIQIEKKPDQIPKGFQHNGIKNLKLLSTTEI